MSYQFSKRVMNMQPSATIAVNTRAGELRAAGQQIINLSVGEPDFDTPDFIKKAALEAIEAGFTKYTPTEGILELREAIIDKLARDNQLSYTPKEILVSAGVKQSLYNLAQVMLDQGDEAIIPAPYWVSYPEIVKVADGTPVIIEASIENNLKITPEQLEKAITDRTRLFILNSPSNPSGMAYTAEELRGLADVLMKHPNILIASDDMYEYILWSQPHYVNILNVEPGLKDRTIVMNGVSKAHAMTGWRIGYAAGPADIIQAMRKIQSQSTTTTCSISQKASVVAIRSDKATLQYMFDAYKERHDYVYAALTKIPDVVCHPADGTFYLFPDVSAVIKKLGLNSDIELATQLLDKGNVAVVPGTAFGSPGHIRISYATDLASLKAAMQQIEQVFTSS